MRGFFITTLEEDKEYTNRMELTAFRNSTDHDKHLNGKLIYTHRKGDPFPTENGEKFDQVMNDLVNYASEPFVMWGDQLKNL